MSTADLAKLERHLCALQSLAARLMISHRNPEKFHVDKDELVKGIAAARRYCERRMT